MVALIIGIFIGGCIGFALAVILVGSGKPDEYIPEPPNA